MRVANAFGSLVALLLMRGSPPVRRRGLSICVHLIAGENLMKKLTVIMGLLLANVSLSDASGAAPGNPTTFPLQSLVERIQSCRAGTYWCPGQVSGCCPNGYGCGSTHCLKPPTVRTPVPNTRTPSVGTHRQGVRTPTITTRAPRVRTPTVRAPDTGACPSLKGIAADMGGLLGC